MIAFAHSLERTVVIRAPREAVFQFLVDSARWASWWGAGSTIDAHAGGRLTIRQPGGAEVTGDVVEVVAPEMIVFTYGYTSGTPMPPGSSRVVIHLDQHADGTRLMLTHEFADATARDEHVQGWRYQLSVLSNAVSNERTAQAAATIDTWLAAWGIADAVERERVFLSVAAPAVDFRDRFSAISGVTELVAQTGAMQRFMPVRLQRTGDIRHCQGTALAEWTATTPDGQARGSGTSAFVFGADGRVTSVVGFWK